MIATNHYLVGVASAALLKNPVIVFPVAFASHFILDALPHFGLKYSKNRGKILLSIGIVDAVVLLVAMVLTVNHYPTWYLPVGIVAISPDFAWVYRFIIKERFGALPPSPRSTFNAWHANIQKLESKRGAVVEIGSAILLSILLF